MKKILYLLFTLFICFGISACGNKEAAEEKTIVENKVSEEKKADTSETSESPNIEMKDNKIYNTVESDDGSVTVSEYVYSKDDTLSEINVTIKMPDEKAAKEMYESITNGELKEEYEKKYDNIQLDDNIISAEMKEESVESMSVLNQEQMYLILGSNITTYNISE